MDRIFIFNNVICKILTSDNSSDDGRASEASLPLSDLWEHDQCLSEEPGHNTDHHKPMLPSTNLTNFGEDYSAYLYSDQSETESELFSDDLEEDDDNKHNSHDISYQILQSKSTLNSMLRQISTESSDKDLVR